MLETTPGGLALAGAGGYVLARRALAPIDHLASAAQRITAARLHEPCVPVRDEPFAGLDAITRRDLGERLTRLARAHSRNATLLIILVGLIVVFSLLSSDFLTSSNLLSTARRGVEIGLISMAMAVVIGSGGIDLSVGPLAGFLVVLASFFVLDGRSPAVWVLGFVLMLAAAAVNNTPMCTVSYPARTRNSGTTTPR